jgi:maleamate amidohydrolase
MDLKFWDGYLSTIERAVIERGGYGTRAILGLAPALLVVDLQGNYVGADEPILNQIDRFPSGVGESAWRSLDALRKLLPAARGANVPVVYTTVVSKSSVVDGSHVNWTMTGGLVRSPEFMTASDPGSQIVADFAPNKSLGDVVIEKAFASAFFGTTLCSYLVRRQIDTILIAGGTTSGCVRATAVDGYSFGFHVGIVADCVFDRIYQSHMASLLDVYMKYGSILSLDEAIEYVTTSNVGIGTNEGSH